jgi:hypothetical protein
MTRITDQDQGRRARTFQVGLASAACLRRGGLDRVMRYVEAHVTEMGEESMRVVPAPLEQSCTCHGSPTG